MVKSELTIPLILNGQDVIINICGENNVCEIEESEAIANGESRYQIKEGSFYEYKITDGYSLECPEVVSRSKIKGQESSGNISPNIYVGTLSIDIFEIDKKQKCGEIKLEVQSVKTTYRQDYRQMLEEITERCTDLLLQHSSPVSQYFEVNFNADANTLYQRFAFIKSIIDSGEFNDSVHKVISAPATRWKESESIKDIRSVKRFSNSAIRQLSSSSNRIGIPAVHSLKRTLKSIPSKIRVNSRMETVDTAENRFVKHALVSFQLFCNDFKTKIKNNSRIEIEAGLLVDKLEQVLSHSIFKEISSPATLPLNSPVLQRKEGYREILRVWLMFDLAARMVWHGGNDVYRGNKRDVAVLYEYWLFFKLLDVIKEIFNLEPNSLNKLIKITEDGLGLQLKQGRCLAIKGVFESAVRKLNIEFSYNKTFTGESIYPKGGSWTKSMRPDYSLSIWPYGIHAAEAEEQELIAHIHFDSKYKVEKMVDIFGTDSDVDTEKEEQRRGTYKRVDLLKMHAYKDAIRRTSGSYILYPGDDNSYAPRGFHEVIPGLGAFAIRPSRLNNGTIELKKFLNEVVQHFQNRISQREKMSSKAYEIYKDENPHELLEILPETYGRNRNLLPDETFVLVAFYKNETHLQWIEKTRRYNARTGSTRGALHLGSKEAGARYLLLHTFGETKTSRFYKLAPNGPQVLSKEKLIADEYPSPTQPYYLVYTIETVVEREFENMMWDIAKLKGYQSDRDSALPFACTLTELMSVLEK